MTIDTNGTQWKTIIEYYDIETGEQIIKRTKAETQEEIKNNYIKLKTTKNGTKQSPTKGTIKLTIECRRNPQTRLF